MALTRRPMPGKSTGNNRARNDDMPPPRRKPATAKAKPAIVIAVGSKKPARRSGAAKR